jgi:hypothetical protein
MVLLASLTFVFFCLMIFAEENREQRQKRTRPPVRPAPPAPARVLSPYEAYLADIRAQIAAQNRR